MEELDHKECWVPKNWWFWTVALEKTLESPLDWKEITPVNPKGNQSWIFTGRTGAEAEAPTFWPPEAKSRLIREDADAGKDWRQEEKGDNRGWTSWVASLTQWTWSEVTQLCPTLCDPMDYNLPGFSVHGIFQARILEWVAVYFSRGSSWPGIEPRSPALQADALPSESKRLPICRIHHVNCWAGWSTSWNQGCQEKYQQPQICWWYHLYDRKQRGPKELLDESEREEWKSWLKTQHSKN